MSEIIASVAVIGGTLLLAKRMKLAPSLQKASLFFHIKEDMPPAPAAKVTNIISAIQQANKTGLVIGYQPQCVTTDFEVELDYYRAFGSFPIMATVYSSDVVPGASEFKLSIPQIEQLREVCSNIQALRFHEVLTKYVNDQNQFDYIRSILEYAATTNIPVFWNEWSVDAFPLLSQLIAGYENNVIVSFGTNADYIEPLTAYLNHLSQFQRKGSSIQSWYWWERQGELPGLELDMPPDIMRLHTLQAFQTGCEIVQYEPFWYFFDGQTPRSTLAGVINEPF